MTMHDAIVLAYTKFRTRKVRSILVTVGSACITALVLFFSIVVTGLSRSVYGTTTPFATKHMLQVSQNNINQATDTNRQAQLDKFIKDKSIDRSSISASYFSTVPMQMNPAELSDLKPTQSNNPTIFSGLQLVFKSNELLEPYVKSSSALNDSTDGVVPVVASTNVIENAFGEEISKAKGAESRQKKIKELQDKYINKVQDLTVSYIPASVDQTKGFDGSSQKTLTLKVKIVGFSPSTNSFFYGMQGSMDGAAVAVTYKVAESNTQLKELVTGPSYYYLSFNSEDAQQKALKQISDSGFDSFATVYGDITGSIRDLVDSAKNIVKWVVVVMLIFVTLPMASTMSKILADSQRETGVFRAIGARNRDIAQIYGVYSAILSIIAFVLGVLISSTIALILTAKYGSLLGAQLNDFAGTTTVPKVVLYGVNVVHWAVLLGILVGSALLGAVLPVLRTLRKDPILAMREE